MAACLSCYLFNQEPVGWTISGQHNAFSTHGIAGRLLSVGPLGNTPATGVGSILFLSLLSLALVPIMLLSLSHQCHLSTAKLSTLISLPITCNSVLC